MLRTLSILVLLAVPAFAGPAFVRDRGVVKIDDAGKVTRLLADKDHAMVLAVDVDGDVWVSSVSGKLHGFKKKKITAQLPGTENAKMPAAMIAAKGGGLWVIGREHLVRVSDKGVVKKHPIPVERVQGPAALAEVGDVLWMASDYGVHKFTGGKWEAVRTEGHEHLVSDGKGTLWSVRKTKGKPDVVASFDGKAWTDAAIDGEGVSALAAGQNGRVFAVQWSSKWKAPQIHVLAGGKWSAKITVSERVHDLVVDEGDRLWVRTDDGLALYSADGKRVSGLASGKVAGIAGQVHDVVVAGKGPTTLPVEGTLVTGAIKGRLMKSAKEPLANAKFKLCATSDCSANALEATTDAAGNFTIAAASQIEYMTLALDSTHISLSSFLKQVGAKSTQQKLDCCLQVAAGKTIDLGTFVVPRTN